VRLTDGTTPVFGGPAGQANQWFGGGGTGLMDRFELLQPVADAAFDRYANTPFDQLSEVDRTIILVWSLQGEVDNGGFDQFYSNSSGDYSAETVFALERIGAQRTAALVAEGNRLFPTQPPPSEGELRIAELDSFSDTARDTWKRLEREFYSDPDGLNERLVGYLVRQGVLPESVGGFAEPNSAADGGGM
jgi:hypothetical protein